jgi:hypothetical protein
MDALPFIKQCAYFATLERQTTVLVIHMSERIVGDILLDIHSPNIHGLDAGLRILVRIQSNSHPEHVALIYDTDGVCIQQNRVCARGHQVDLGRPRTVIIKLHGNIIGRLKVLLFTRTRLGRLNLKAGVEQRLRHLRIGNDNVAPSLVRAEAVLRRITCKVGLENEFGVVDDNQSRFVHGLQISFN